MAIPSEVAGKLEAAIRRFASEAGRCAHNAGPDEVHDVRVSIRRLEQALDIFAQWLPPKPVRKILGRLKETLKMAGDVRDRDIAVELIGEVRSAIQSERYAASARFMAALGDLTAAEVPAKWEAKLGLAETTEGRVLAALAVTRLPALAAGFIASGSQLAHDPKSRRRFHSFRVSAKRFRYSMELVSDPYGPAIDRRVAAVRKIQTALGDLQDSVATRRMLRGIGISRAVLRPLRHEENKRLARFQELWPKLFGPRAAGVWERALSGQRTAFSSRRPAARVRKVTASNFTGEQ
jgi:CHAD domain-containing protein